MNPFFLFDNRFASGTLTATTEASGYPVGNAPDWRPFDRWRASNTTSPVNITTDLGASATGDADTYIVAAHNLKTAGATLVAFQYSDDGVTWVTADSANPQDWADEKPITVVSSGAGEHRYWRCAISGTLTTAPEIGVLTAGVRLELTAGVMRNWDPYARTDFTEWSTNKYGQPLGANFIACERRMTLDLGKIGYTDDELWKKTAPNWDDDFTAHYQSKWFWWAWNTDREPYHVWLSRIDGTPSFQFVNVVGRRTAKVPLLSYVPA